MAVSIALATAVAPARAEVAAAPFDGNLQRLAEILGALRAWQHLRRERRPEVAQRNAIPGRRQTPAGTGAPR